MPPDATSGTARRFPARGPNWAARLVAPITTAGPEGIVRLRLTLYTTALGAAFGVDLLVEGFGQGTAFWSCGLAACLALVWGSVRGGALLRFGVGGALALALAVPLGPALVAGTHLGPLLAATPAWPQILVALFASRVLAEDCDLRFARFWRRPLDARAPVQVQSFGAAVALGVFFTLLFYQGFAWAAPAISGETSFSAIVLAAMTGETVIHRGIVFLFFVILSFLVDSALQHRRDRAAFRALQGAVQARSRLGQRVDAETLRAMLDERGTTFGEVEATRLVEEAYDWVSPKRPAGRALAAASFSAFRGSSRRFVRGLLPFLPMLGFFGTVVGLATAMAALPTSAPEGGSVDISGSLSGLAVKFQTTLLGIMASLLASAVLGFIERSETELSAECALFVGRIEGADAS